MVWERRVVNSIWFVGNHIRFSEHSMGVSYHRDGLADIFINPAYQKVFPPDFKLILNQDGAKKNDCERNVTDFLNRESPNELSRVRLLALAYGLTESAPESGRI
jgi:hypothetical protein